MGVICAGFLVVLQLSTYAIEFGENRLDPTHAVQTLPAAVVLVVASGAGFLLSAAPPAERMLGDVVVVVACFHGPRSPKQLEKRS